MPEQFYVTATTFRPPNSEPTCCPDAFLCLSGEVPEVECPRHGGFDVCCDKPEFHVPQDRDAWHQQMSRWEQGLLDEHIRTIRTALRANSDTGWALNAFSPQIPSS
ncbi:hypothetical protein ACPCSE_29825 [Streptomyces cellulosae]